MCIVPPGTVKRYAFCLQTICLSGTISSVKRIAFRLSGANSFVFLALI